MVRFFKLFFCDKLDFRETSYPHCENNAIIVSADTVIEMCVFPSESRSWRGLIPLREQ